jgi:molybdenum cofactor biosynthesis enzyme MoaA
MRWLELAAGYACNCACPGCHSQSADPSQQMDSPEALRWLRHGRVNGARHAWFGGGEPTVRRDFVPLLKAAKTLGYERIKVQTNGLMFAYPELVERAVAAGMNEVNLLLRHLDPARHDPLMGRPGALELQQRALENLRGRGLRLEGDVLLTAPTLAGLPALVRHYAARDVVHFNLWLFSTADSGAADLRALVPTYAALAPVLREARQIARDSGATMVSLHTPHCLVAPAEWDLQFDPAGMGLFIANPGGQAFLLGDSVMEQAAHVEACAGCAVRGPCRGPRPEYVALHGTAGLRPFTAAEAAGHDPMGSVLDR